MPVDHKRINGPEESVPYKLFSRINIKSLEGQFKEAVDKRVGSRKVDQPRKIFLKTDVVSQAKGSSYIEVGNTKVIVSVFDPREIPNRTDYSLKGEIYCEFKFAPFSCPKRRLHQQDNEEKHLSAIMKKALEPAVCRQEFPNFQVDIYALVLQNDGSALSAAITAAGLALAHAGVPMYDIVTSVTVGIQLGVNLIDPDLIEEELCHTHMFKDKDNDNHGVIVISKLHSQEQVSQFYQTGNLSLHNLSFILEVILGACDNLVPLVQKCLVKHVVKSFNKDHED